MTDSEDDRRDPAAQTTPDDAATGAADVGEAPRLGGDDVRLGPDLTDEPQAGATEPSD